MQPLLLAIEIRVEVPAETLGRIIESQLLVKSVNLGDILGVELEVAFEVSLYAGWCFALSVAELVYVNTKPRTAFDASVG